MVTVLLYGHLAKAFGRKHVLDIRTPAEAVRALCVNFPKFRQHVIDHGQPGYKVLCGDELRDAKHIHDPVFAPVLKIVPVVSGSGGDFGQILLGAALIGISFIPGLQAPMFIEGLGGELFGATSLASIAGNIGFSLVLGGIAGMLFSPSKPASTPTDKPENKPSYVFDGAVNTMAQGNAVPVCYGKLIVGSQVISTGINAQEI